MADPITRGILNVYKVVDGGGWCWIAAGSPEEAVALLRDEHGDDVSLEAVATLADDSELDRVRLDRESGYDFWTLRGDLARLAGPCLMAGSMY